MPEPADVPTFTAPGAQPRAEVARPDAIFQVDKPGTELEGLLAELGEKLAAETTIPIPGRPGWAVVYNADLDHQLLGRWRRNSRDPDQPDNLDELKYALTILAGQCVRILRHGEVMALDGAELTFRSPAFQRLLGAPNANDAVRTAYGRDAHVLTASTALLVEAGYTDEQRGEDPTPSS